MSTLNATTVKADIIMPIAGVPSGGGGGIVQVIQGTTSTEVASTANTYADTGLSVTITPKSSSSKILIIVSQAYENSRSSSDQALSGIRLLRDSTVIEQGPNDGSGNQPHLMGSRGASSDTTFAERYNLTMIDSPSTTSAITYKTQHACRSTGNSYRIKCQPAGAAEDPTSYITAMEISA
tara:strand:+ start:140 stop:679 length:540 start_codon:yes stop_codon:yes gene_type:complete